MISAYGTVAIITFTPDGLLRELGGLHQMQGDHAQLQIIYKKYETSSCLVEGT